MESLNTIAARLDALDADFVATACRETALPTTCIQGERSHTSGQLRLFAEVLRRGDFHGARIDRARPECKPLPRVDLYQYRIGFDPVAVFSASNFPLAFPAVGDDTAAALAAGCPVTSKVHSGHTVTAGRVVAAILRAVEHTGILADVFNMIYGGGVGERLVHHLAIQAVGFTGLLKGGCALCDMAAARAQPTPVLAEMSSISPVVLLSAALKKRGRVVAGGLSALVVLDCGQFYTNPGLVIGIRSMQFSALLERLVVRMGGQSARTMLNADMLASYEKDLAVLHAHPRVCHLAGQPRKGRQTWPQLFQTNVSLLLESDELPQEEVFGLVSVVIEVANHAELKRTLHRLYGQLAATPIAEAEDLASSVDLAPLLEQKAGHLLLGGYPTGVEVCDAMVRGGPHPVISDTRGTSVDTPTIERFPHPVCYRNYPDAWPPEALKGGNPLGIARLVNGIVARTVVA